MTVEAGSGAIASVIRIVQRLRVEPGSRAERLRWLCGSGRKRSGAVACAAIILALPLLAQQTRLYQEGNSWVEETTGKLSAARELRINTGVGSIEVRGTARNIAYVVRKRVYASTKEEAQQQFQRMKVTAANIGHAAVLEGELLQPDMTRFTADISLQVPRDIKKVLLETGGGTLTLTSLAASVVGKTGAGAVKLEDIARPVTVTTGGGEVAAGTLGSDVSIKSGGGSVRIERIGGRGDISTGGGTIFVGSAHGLTAKTVGGPIEVRECAGDLTASTGGGNVSLGNVAGAVQVDAVAGSVRLASATGNVQVNTGGGSVELFKLSRGAKVDTGSGAITVEFLSQRGHFADSHLHTAAGDVLVFLPGNLPVTVHASADMAPGYGIHSEFPGIHISNPGGNFAPRSMWAEGALNGGGPLLRVRTGLGHVDFRKVQ